MGYTHYLYRDKELEENRFKIAVDECRKVCEGLPIPLGDAMGENEPVFSDDRIEFNGHIYSSELAEGLAKADISIPWPAPKASGVAIVGEQAQAGKWFAGDLLSSRCLNADGDGSYESFIVPRVINSDRPTLSDDDDNPETKGKYFSFCKTAYRPYDLNVQCCLIILKQHLKKAIYIASDGGPEDWEDAKEVCQQALGYGKDFWIDSWDEK